MLIYARHISINDKNILSHQGPLLIAANHPNSFLDAIILASLFKKPIYSLVRGDVYKNKCYAAILTSLNMLPVYRISEGSENLDQNYSSFEKCRSIFKKNGIVLIFSEGRCINEWHLRPLKKGTARLATSSWEEGINLAVLPTGINYQSFTSFGKNIHLNFGDIIYQKDMPQTNGHGNTLNEFNNLLQSSLQKLVYEIDQKDTSSRKQQFSIPQPTIKKILLFFPAVSGYILHFPLYTVLKNYAWKKARHNDHYDSVLVGLLFVCYPIYLLIIVLITALIMPGFYWILTILLLPFFAWSLVQLKPQF